jgi:16S rRNA (cytidine1402-2'-O)-methyltransferase
MAAQQSSKNSEARTEEASQVPGVLKAALMTGLGNQLGKLAASPLAPGLYLVSTPIGNLGDISLRALFILASADVALCEDTRHSRKLLSAYGIRRRLEAYHDFSSSGDRARILAALAAGKSVALISDAGTPLVADPGFKLVRAAIAEGFDVFAIPGPSAILAALVTSGLPPDQFFFGGFLSPKEGARRDQLEAARALPGTLIFYESGSRLEETLQALHAVFPDRSIVIARELTKLYEALMRGKATELLTEIRANPPAGEFVILIGPGEAQSATETDIRRALQSAMGRMSLKEAVEEVAKGLGAGRKMVYNLALKIREQNDDNA